MEFDKSTKKKLVKTGQNPFIFENEHYETFFTMKIAKRNNIAVYRLR